MPAFTVFPDQNLRGGLRASLGLVPQPGGESEEGCTLLRHGILDRTFENVPNLAFQGTLVASGTSLEAPDHLVIQLPHVDRRHRDPRRIAINPVSSHGEARRERLREA